MSQYLCQFIKVQVEAAVNKLKKYAPEHETAFTRGFIAGLEEILNMPEVIKRRKDAEREPAYRTIMELSNKEPN